MSLHYYIKLSLICSWKVFFLFISLQIQKQSIYNLYKKYQKFGESLMNVGVELYKLSARLRE